MIVLNIYFEIFLAEIVLLVTQNQCNRTVRSGLKPEIEIAIDFLI